MGLSTTYANILMFAFVLTVIFILYSAFADYLTETRLDVMAQGDYLARRLDTSVQIASMTASATEVIFYVVNDGRASIKPDCTDVYVDRQWIKPSEKIEVLILNDTFDPGLWNPHETLKVRADYPVDIGPPHEGRVVTCNGVSDSRVFYRVD